MARWIDVVLFPSRGVAEVMRSERGLRLRSERRMESRSVRMASSKAETWPLLRPPSSRADCAVPRDQRQFVVPGLFTTEANPALPF